MNWRTVDEKPQYKELIVIFKQLGKYWSTLGFYCGKYQVEICEPAEYKDNECYNCSEDDNYFFKEDNCCDEPSGDMCSYCPFDFKGETAYLKEGWYMSDDRIEQEIDTDKTPIIGWCYSSELIDDCKSCLHIMEGEK